MSEEMQAAEPAVEQSNITLDSEPVEQAEEPSESSADTGENQEQKVTFSDEQQAVFNKKIGEQTFKRREAQRQAEGREADLQRKLDEMQAKLPVEQKPEVAALPDPDTFYGDEAGYAAAMNVRDQSIRDAERFSERAEARAEFQREQAAASQKSAQEAQYQQLQEYSNRATALGVTAEELSQAGQALGVYGFSNDLNMTIIKDDHGPFITKYLAANPTISDSLSRLDPISAGIALASIKIEASKLMAPKPTAPDPVESISGAGGRPKKPGGNHSYV